MVAPPHTDSPASCTWLGRYYEEGRGGSQDIPYAVSLFDLACSLDFALGCTNLGWNTFYGSGTPTNEPVGIQILLHACMLEDGWGCLEAGRAITSSTVEVTSELFTFPSAGLSPLEQEWAEFVADAGRTEGRFVLSLYERACELGQEAACESGNPAANPGALNEWRVSTDRSQGITRYWIGAQGTGRAPSFTFSASTDGHGWQTRAELVRVTGTRAVPFAFPVYSRRWGFGGFAIVGVYRGDSWLWPEWVDERFPALTGGDDRVEGGIFVSGVYAQRYALLGVTGGLTLIRSRERRVGVLFDAEIEREEDVVSWRVGGRLQTYGEISGSVQEFALSPTWARGDAAFGLRLGVRLYVPEQLDFDISADGTTTSDRSAAEVSRFADETRVLGGAFFNLSRSNRELGSLSRSLEYTLRAKLNALAPATLDAFVELHLVAGFGVPFGRRGTIRVRGSQDSVAGGVPLASVPSIGGIDRFAAAERNAVRGDAIGDGTVALEYDVLPAPFSFSLSAGLGAAGVLAEDPDLRSPRSSAATIFAGADLAFGLMPPSFIGLAIDPGTGDVGASIGFNLR